MSSTNQKKLDQIRKYASTQGLPLDSQRVRKYAIGQGVNPDELMTAQTEGAAASSKDEAVRKYAERMNLPISDKAVQRYAQAGEADEQELIDVEGSDDIAFKQAVVHYAQSQGLTTSTKQVQKYARGLLKPTGDFSEEAKPMPTPESSQRRFDEAIQRYAESVGLDVNSEQVQKYANGLRKTNIIPVQATPPQVRRNQQPALHVDGGDSHVS